MKAIHVPSCTILHLQNAKDWFKDRGLSMTSRDEQTELERNRVTKAFGWSVVPIHMDNTPTSFKFCYPSLECPF